jgi:hypothetical protein
MADKVAIRRGVRQQNNLSKAGWTWGCASAVDSHGRTIWIADANRDDGTVSLCVRAKVNVLYAAFGSESAIPGSRTAYLFDKTRQRS